MNDRQPRTDHEPVICCSDHARKAVTVASRGPDLAGLRKALERFVSLTDGWGPALDPASPWMEAYQQGRAALQAGATEPGADATERWLQGPNLGRASGRTAEPVPDANALTAEVDRHWMDWHEDRQTAVCSCGGWQFDAERDIRVGEHFAPFSRHVAEALRAALASSDTEPRPFEYGGALVNQRFASDVEPSPDLAFADALVAWFDVTHADTFGHDHHCPSKGDEDDDCTCGWTAVHRTDRARAALHTETSGEDQP